jgi:pilus assembly protein CpaB
VSLVNGYAGDVRAQVGPLVPVAVARVDVPRGKLVSPSNAPRLLAVRRVPERFVGAGSLRAPREAIGYRTAVRLPAGAYVGEAALALEGSSVGGREQPPRVAAARAVEVSVSGATGLADALRPGAVVDVLVTSDRGGGPPRTYLAVQRLDLLDVRPAAADRVGESEAAEGSTVAVLRVTLRQALLLTAAQNFARELRLVPRDPGDPRRFPRVAVTADELHP